MRHLLMVSVDAKDRYNAYTILYEIEITCRRLTRDLQIKKVSTCIEIQLGEGTSYQHQRTKHFPLQPSQVSLQMSSLPRWQSAQNLGQSSGSCS